MPHTMIGTSPFRRAAYRTPRSKYQRRHYTDIAAMLKAMLDDDKRTLFTSTEVSRLTETFIRLFESDNERFSADRFRSAIWSAESPGNSAQHGG